jgi:hypothetical protein
MDAALAGQLAEGVLAGDGEGGRLDARLFAVLVVVHLGFEALLLGPAQVHAHQHLGPVLALGAARAGMHGDDGVQRIGLAVEHGARFQLLGKGGQGLDVALQIGEHVFALAGQLEVGSMSPVRRTSSSSSATSASRRLRSRISGLVALGFGPERRIGQLGFYFGEFPADASRVKDTPAGRGLGRAREHKRIRDRSTTWLGSLT